MAYKTPARPSAFYILHHILARLLLHPFGRVYSRRFERNLVKGHYEPVNHDELRLARSEFDEIAAEAREAGLTSCGSYTQVPGTGSGREELQLWLNDRRDALLVVHATRVWLYPRRLERRVISHLGDGRTVATVCAWGIFHEVSGLENAKLFHDVTLGELLVKHEWRLAELDAEPLPFDAANAIGEYEQLHWLRVQRMADLSYATIVNAETTQWRYTQAGEDAGEHHNRITPEERQVRLEREGLL